MMYVFLSLSLFLKKNRHCFVTLVDWVSVTEKNFCLYKVDRSTFIIKNLPYVFISSHKKSNYIYFFFPLTNLFFSPPAMYFTS